MAHPVVAMGSLYGDWPGMYGVIAGPQPIVADLDFSNRPELAQPGVAGDLAGLFLLAEAFYGLLGEPQVAAPGKNTGVNPPPLAALATAVAVDGFTSWTWVYGDTAIIAQLQSNGGLSALVGNSVAGTTSGTLTLTVNQVALCKAIYSALRWLEADRTGTAHKMFVALAEYGDAHDEIQPTTTAEQRVDDAGTFNNASNLISLALASSAAGPGMDWTGDRAGGSAHDQTEPDMRYACLRMLELVPSLNNPLNQRIYGPNGNALFSALWEATWQKNNPSSAPIFLGVVVGLIGSLAAIASGGIVAAAGAAAAIAGKAIQADADLQSLQNAPDLPLYPPGSHLAYAYDGTLSRSPWDRLVCQGGLAASPPPVTVASVITAVSPPPAPAPNSAAGLAASNAQLEAELAALPPPASTSNSSTPILLAGGAALGAFLLLG